MLYKIKNLVRERPGDRGYRLLIRRLRVPARARIALEGPSGCGKSTTLDVLGLSLRPDSAEEFLFCPDGGAGKQIDVMSAWNDGKQDELADLRLARVGYILQSGELLPFLNVLENMTLVARLSGKSREEAAESALALAARLRVEKLCKAMPASLSFGERQRVAIVRALAARPQVVLADEPTAALDPLNAEKVMDAFLSALDQFGGAMILVTHNAAWAEAGGFRAIHYSLVEEENRSTAIVDDGEPDSPC